MKSFREMFEEGGQMVRDSVAQNIRQAPYHHKEQRVCWQAGALIALEELAAEAKVAEKAKAEAPKPVKHVGPAPSEMPKAKKPGKKK